MRIISGKYKGRVIPTLKSADYRPSMGKLKEAIFSILAAMELKNSFSFANINVLDLFSGTGSLAFEALSRGAASITLVDIQKEYLKVARDFSDILKKAENCTIINMDVLRLPHATQSFDLIFLDPPYHKNLTTKTLEHLLSKNWLKQQSLIVAEMAKPDEIIVNDEYFLEITKRTYGNSKLVVLRKL